MATTALDSSRNAPISRPDRFYIGGKWVWPSTESHIDVIAPATEELFLRVAEAQESDIANAVAAAREAFDRGPWPRLSHEERAVYLAPSGTTCSAAISASPSAASSSRVWAGRAASMACCRSSKRRPSFWTAFPRVGRLSIDRFHGGSINLKLTPSWNTVE